MPSRPAEESQLPGEPLPGELLPLEARAGLRLPFVALAFTLLVIEALTLSYLYDVRGLLELGAWWSGVGYIGSWLPLGFVAAAGALTATLPRLLAESKGRSPRATWVWVGLGSLGFAASLGATEWLMSSAAPGGAALSVWGLAILSWLVLRAGSVMPLQSWKRAAHTHGGRALSGAAIGSCAFGASWLLQDGWSALAPVTLHGAAGLLRLTGQEPWIEPPSTLGLGEFAVEIAPVCSGVEGMGLLAILVLGFIVVRRRELALGRALWLVPLGVFGAFGANLARIAVLLALGSRGHEDVAIGGFHSKAGWVFFTLLAIALLRLLDVRAFRKGPHEAEEARSGNEFTSSLFDSPAALRLLPLVALTLVGLLTEAAAASIDHLYAARALVGLGVLLWAAPRLPELTRPALPALGIGLVTGLGAFLLWWQLVPFDAARAGAVALEFSALPPWRFQSEMALRALGGVIVVPLAEELAFRSYLTRRLGRAEFETVRFADTHLAGVAVSGVVFGALHGQAWLPGVLVGLAYGLSQKMTNSFVVAAIGHGVTNLGVWLSVAFFGRLDWF